MNPKQLTVHLKSEPIGILEQTAAGKMNFTYNNTAAQSLSLGMPLREQPYNEIH